MNQSALNKIPVDSRAFLYFFKKIKLSLKRKGWNKNANENCFSVKFYTRNFGFNFNALKEVKKIYGLLGWNLKLTYYGVTEDQTGFDYEFNLIKT